jgi:hypothetical protein
MLVGLRQRGRLLRYKSQIESLERDKEALERDKVHLREESVRKDHIIMSLTQRIPAIEAPAHDDSHERDSVVSDFADTGKGSGTPRRRRRRNQAILVAEILWSVSERVDLGVHKREGGPRHVGQMATEVTCGRVYRGGNSSSPRPRKHE